MSIGSLPSTSIIRIFRQRHVDSLHGSLIRTTAHGHEALINHLSIGVRVTTWRGVRLNKQNGLRCSDGSCTQSCDTGSGGDLSSLMCSNSSIRHGCIVTAVVSDLTRASRMIVDVVRHVIHSTGDDDPAAGGGVVSGDNG